MRDLLTEVEGDSIGVIDKHAQRLTGGLDEQHLDIGSARCKPGLDIWCKCVQLVLFSVRGHKKSGRAPTSSTATGFAPALQKLCAYLSTGKPLRGLQCRP